MAGAILAAAAVGVVRAELGPWVQHVRAGNVLAMFFRSVPMPEGDVSMRRLPSETRVALQDAIRVTPAVPDLYRLRGREDEMALDFAAAEADWRKFAQLERERTDGYRELADYYERREQPAKEIEALRVVAAGKTSDIRPFAEQAPWQATERIARVAAMEGLADGVAAEAFESWMKLHPADAHGYETAIDFLVTKKLFDRAGRALDAYAKQFPVNTEYVVEKRAALLLARGQSDAAADVYAQAFDPLWPATLSGAWFDLLESQGSLRAFVGQQRAALETNAADLGATARLFHYYVKTANAGEQRRVLFAYRAAKQQPGQSSKPQELWVLGQLLERLPDPDDAARCYYAMYSAPGAVAADGERALGALAGLLLRDADQGVTFGSGDLSFYRDIAQADAAPGFLNGILSLLLNSASPRREYETQNRKATAYFHRAAAARLIDLLAQRNAQSNLLGGLRAGLIDAYAGYAQHDAVIAAGRAYLADFPKGADRVKVALRMADSFEALGRVNEEFATYDALLKELAAATQNVPLGEHGGEQAGTGEGGALRQEMLAVAPQGQPEGAGPEKAESGPRSRDYQDVLNRYLARLSQLKRPMEALQLYRREIDRNPNDPGLIREFAAYLDNNRLATQLIETYRRAMARFPNGNWYDALGRWYLRKRRLDDLERLTREVTGIFSGSELEKYFAAVVPDAAVDARLYLRVNLYAHEKFPADMAFVQNLLAAYSQRETANGAAYSQLVRSYWYYDDNLRRMYLRSLEAAGQLESEISAVRARNQNMAQGKWAQAEAENPAAVHLVAEGEAWLSHFELSGPAFRAEAEAMPRKKEATMRASSVYRSLAYYFPEDTNVAVNLMQMAYRADPRDREALDTVGDIYADRDELGRARPVWNSIVKIEPGNNESWLNAATVFWDYYLFGDALRVFADGRRRFGNATLFAYQTGAIYEGERNYAEAVREYAAGAVAGNGEAQNRLLKLAKRKPQADLVDKATAALVVNPGVATAPARALRIQVLEAQNRRDSLGAFLQAVLGAAATPAVAEEVAAAAERDGFDDLGQSAKQREIALTSDPILKMRLGIALARFDETHGQTDQAAALMDGLYQSHPQSLGVVRAVVDFEKRSGKPDRAMAILLRAAKDAYPGLADQFTLEAARTATDAGQYDRARDLLAGLRKKDPLRAEYLDAEADTYARAKDDAGFETFTLAAIQAVRAAPLPPAERAQRVASLRRGLIPVLTREGAFDRAMTQYIEVLDSYPEDDGLAREAAEYAMAHQRLDQMLGFYRKTIQQAPRDYRWPIVLARIETVVTDFPAAIGSYAQAMKDRPDRADLAEARALLEVRLLRFDDAIASYRKLYGLTYQNPEWLRHIAELEARLGRATDAVNDLRAAVIGDRTESSGALLEIANTLDRWDLVTEAVGYAERAQAGDTDPEPDYFRIVARARKWDGLFSKDAIKVLAASPGAFNGAAKVVAEEYTPEEKAEVDRRLSGTGEGGLDFARAAGMAPLEAEIELAKLKTGMGGEPDVGAYVELQKQRGLFGEMGHTMEQLAASEGNGRIRIAELTYAAKAYVAVGDTANGTRVMDGLVGATDLGELRDWYLEELSKQAPERLILLARGAPLDALRDAATQAAISKLDVGVALRAVEARATGEKPVWGLAYRALTGLYFADPAAAIGEAFVAALGSGETIGMRVKNPVNRDQRLAGPVWFYYGARFGEYLNDTSGREKERADATRFLPAALEGTPNSPQAYMNLGGFYEEHDRVDEALARYGEALQLDANRGDAHDHMARILWKHGRQSEAMTEWRAAIEVYERMQSRGVAVPEPFWGEAVETIGEIGRNGVLPQLQAELNRWLEDYVRRNDSYRLAPLLSAAFAAAVSSHLSTDWILDISAGVSEPSQVWEQIQTGDLSFEERAHLKRRLIEAMQKRAGALHGDEQSGLEYRIDQERVELVGLLLDAGKVKEAASEWEGISEERQRRDPGTAVRVAAATGRLAELLEAYRGHPERAPDVGTLLGIVDQLRKRKQTEAALAVAEFTYRRELDHQNLDAANFLGLAEVELERKQQADAVALLRRMNLVSGEPFATYLPAARLLEKYGFTKDAEGFLRDAVKAVPWDAEAGYELGKLVAGGEKMALLNRVVGDAHAGYEVRVAAATALAPGGSSNAPAHSELAAVASGDVSLQTAEQPYRIRARESAARVAGISRADALRLLREASGIDPLQAAVRLEEIWAALAAGRDRLGLTLSLQGLSAQAGDGMGNAAWMEQAVSDETARAAIYGDLSRAAERLGDIDAAISFAQLAKVVRGLATDPRLETLQAEQRRRVENAARQPFVRASVEQANVVRPRIEVARAGR